MNHIQFNTIKKKSVTISFLVIFMFLSTMLSPANKKNSYTPPEIRLEWYKKHVAMQDISMFKHLKWQFLGPTNISGRMTDVAVVTPKGKKYTLYVAGASGGVWKSDNEGTTWEPIFQHAMSTAIGDITIAPSAPNIIWIGTGEANIFRSSQAGAGVYKSTDAGKTWEHMGLIDTNTIPRIIIHPNNPNIVYVAAGGHEWTNNTQRGIFKTEDGGNSWQKILYIDEKTGANDLVMDPQNPNILYATTWQRIRKKWNDPRNESHYSGSGVYKTTDGGKNWISINNGLPPAKFRGRIGIDICQSKPNVLYTYIDHYETIGNWEKGENDSYGRPKTGIIRGATVYRSDDHGMNWEKVSQENQYMQNLSSTYGWVFGQIRVDPNNENTIYVMGLELNVSTDGGKTFKPLKGMHLDQHGLWIDPANSNYLVNVNDGGIAISYDGGNNWKTFYDNAPLVQFFTVNVDMGNPFYAYGSIQDHGSYRGLVDLRKGRNQIPVQKWEMAPGGEGSNHAIDPTDTNIVYYAGFYGNIQRTNLQTGEIKSIRPQSPKDTPPYRGQWLAPFIISPHNPRILYFGMNHLFRSMNRGDSWEKISPDLTYNDPQKIGDIQYQTIFTISESPFQFGLIYVGTDDGRVHVTHDCGKHWTEITKGLAPNRWISRVEASKFNQKTVYLSQNGKRDDDFTAYLWKSTNFGKTWEKISNNIPCGPINVIREDPVNENLLYVGTDFGVYVSIDKGKSWHTLHNNLPTTYVHDLIIHPRDGILLAATHGRGMWAMDVQFLQKLTPNILSKKLHLFEVDSAKLPRPTWRGWRGGQKAYFFYYLAETTPMVNLKIIDQSKNIIQKITGSGNKGINTIIWDLKPASKDNPKSKDHKKRHHPFAEPGQYQLELTIDNISVKGELEIKK